MALRVGFACSFTVDRFAGDGVHRVQPGGPALYSSLAARSVGADPVVYSAVGFDFEEAWLTRLEALGVKVAGVERVADRLTTMFTIIFDGTERRLYSLARLRLDDYFERTVISEGKLYASFTFGEVRGQTLSHILRGREVFLDLQGFSRVADKAGLVKAAEPQIEFAGIKYLKISDEEAFDVVRLIGRARRAGVNEIVVTMGGRGAAVHTQSEKYLCPALCEPASPFSTVGAGDVFGSTYFTARVSGLDVGMALSKASVAAAEFVRRAEPQPFFTLSVDKNLVEEVAAEKIVVREVRE